MKQSSLKTSGGDLKNDFPFVLIKQKRKGILRKHKRDYGIIPEILQSRSENVCGWMKWNKKTSFSYDFLGCFYCLFTMEDCCVVERLKEKGATEVHNLSACVYVYVCLCVCVGVLNYLKICAKDIRQNLSWLKIVYERFLLGRVEMTCNKIKWLAECRHAYLNVAVEWTP